MKIEEFMELVAEMRQYQELFFKRKRAGVTDVKTMEASKEVERKVDAIIKAWKDGKQKKDAGILPLF